MKGHYPCLLLLNDIHISKDNIPAFKANWQETIDICRKMDVKEIAIGGDLFFSRAAQTLDVLLAVHDALLTAAEHGIHVTIAEGNHDKVNQENERGYCHVFDQHSNVLVCDEYVSLPLGDDCRFVLHMMGYFPEDGSFCTRLDRLKEEALDPKRLNFLYIHEGINGALAQPNDKELPAKIFEEFDKVFVGHYHNRTIIDKTRIEYIGSSRQHNFGEDEEKGYTVIYTDGSHEFIKNKVNTRYRVIDVSAERAGLHLMDELREIDADGRYKVKVRVHAPQAAMKSVDKAALLDAGATKVELIADDEEMLEVAASSLFEKFDSHRIRETYEEFCREKQIDDVAIGLEYLSKIEGQCGN
ncbi:MAG: metallophosphoesterase [Bacteroidales bacterium]|nr:metallophosphoesterase [Bacteroidales bacterium]